MKEASGIALHFVRCNAPDKREGWDSWHRETYLPEIGQVESVRSASHWALTEQPEPGMPSVGFSHVTILELSGEVDGAADRIRDAHRAIQAKGEMHPNHSVMNVDLLESHGRWGGKSAPAEGLSGHILAYVLCNDPLREAEWDAWNDDVHMPDMMASGAFEGVTRWRRRRQGEWGTQFLTLYDVGAIGVEEAVRRSAAVMPGIVQAGRKHDCHAGGLTLTLARA